MICQNCGSQYGEVIKAMDAKSEIWQCNNPDCGHRQPWGEDEPIRMTGIRPAKIADLAKNWAHCCEMMQRQADYVCDDKAHKNKFDCPDNLIWFNDSRYGLIIHDGGSSFIEIQHCPWCGSWLEDKHDAR